MAAKARRRGPKEGSIYQRRSDGLWVGAVNLGWESGKLKRKLCYGRTRAEVAEKLKVLNRDQQLGTLRAGRVPTVGQFLREWLAVVQDEGQGDNPKVQASTVKRYRELVELHLIPSLGHLKIDRLSAQHVEALMSAKAAEGKLSAQTITHMRAVLRAALNRAMRWDLIVRNVAKLTQPPKVTPYRAQALDEAEARRLLVAARGDRLEALYTVAVALGLRQGEAFGLRWQDVDLERRTVRIEHALKRVAGKPYLGTPKSSTSRRALHLPEMVASALLEHQERQMTERGIASTGWKGPEPTDGGCFVFTTPFGTPLDPTNVLRWSFRPLLKRAGLPEALRYHDLRHSAGSILMAQGMPAKAVQEFLGHSDYRLTMNRYVHGSSDMAAESAAAMDRALSGIARSAVPEQPSMVGQSI